MNYLQKAREERKLTQLQVSQQTGISRTQLQRLETGSIVASAKQAASLRQLYGIAVLEADNLVDPSEVRRRTGINPYLLETNNPQPWNLTRAAWAKKTAIPAELWDWMSQFLPSDSGLECSGLAQFAAAGAEAFIGSPTQWGFDRLVVVDRQGKLLGARVLPGLCYSNDNLDLVIWPQVSLRIDDRHCYRVDGLVFFRKGRKRIWLILEFDGEGHNFNRDAYRGVKIGLPEVRITAEEIKQGRVVAQLLKRAEEALNPS